MTHIQRRPKQGPTARGEEKNKPAPEPGAALHELSPEDLGVLCSRRDVRGLDPNDLD